MEIRYNVPKQKVSPEGEAIMESAITIFNQILKMFLMMSVGYLLYRKADDALYMSKKNGRNNYTLKP